MPSALALVPFAAMSRQDTCERLHVKLDWTAPIGLRSYTVRVVTTTTSATTSPWFSQAT